MSEPTLRCNACGHEVPIRRAMGRLFKVCSPECIREMEWRNALSVMRQPYRPSPESEAWAKRVLGEDQESST